MDLKDIAQYIEITDGASKPWLLIQLRLKRLEADRPHLDLDTYHERLQELHRDMMALGEWWVGREEELF